MRHNTMKFKNDRYPLFIKQLSLLFLLGVVFFILSDIYLEDLISDNDDHNSFQVIQSANDFEDNKFFNDLVIHPPILITNDLILTVCSFDIISFVNCYKIEKEIGIIDYKYESSVWSRSLFS